MDDKRDGLSTFWYESGQKEKEKNYEDGELHGLSTFWYESGQKMEEKNYKDGKYIQQVSNQLDTSLRDDLERLKKIRNHRGLRHYWGIRVRGQHTKTTGRRGKR